MTVRGNILFQEYIFIYTAKKFKKNKTDRYEQYFLNNLYFHPKKN